MKLYRNALLLLLVLGILTVAYFVSMSFKNTDTDPDYDEVETIKIFSFDSEKAKSVVIKNTKESFEFIKKDNEWKVVEPKDLLRLDTLKVENIVSKWLV